MKWLNKQYRLDKFPTPMGDTLCILPTIINNFNFLLVFPHISFVLTFFFFPQELHWCGLLSYFHHRHPWLHRSGYHWWVWHIAADNITQRFMTHKDSWHTTAHAVSFRTCKRAVIRSGPLVVWKCEFHAPPALPGCTKQNLELVEQMERWKVAINVTQAKQTHSSPQDAPTLREKTICFLFLFLLFDFFIILWNAAPPTEISYSFSKWKFSHNTQLVWLTQAEMIMFSEAVLMSLSSFSPDNQWFPVALILFKFSWSHQVHWSVTESPLCLHDWGHAVLWISPSALLFFLPFSFSTLPSSSLSF